jgi:putative intracellular protease/amidase
MKKILYFIFEGMADYEVTLSMHLLGADAGMEVVTIAYEKSEIKSRSGVIYKPHKKVSEVLDEEVEGLIICGGWYGEVKEELSKLITRLDKDDKLLAGICGAGTFILAKTGVLDNRKYTSSVVEWTEKHISIFGSKDPYPRENYEKNRVVRDRNVITSVGEAFVDFAIEICDWFSLFENNEEKKEFISYMKG